MSGIEVALLASAAVSAGAAVASASAAGGQSKANIAGIRMQQEQLAVQRDSTALQAQEAETQRRARARLTDSTLITEAIAQGLDPGMAGTVGTLQTENARTTEADVGAIKLGNYNNQRQSYLQDRSLSLQTQVWKANARNAWIQAGFQVAGAGLSAARAGGSFGGGGGGGGMATEAGLSKSMYTGPGGPI